MYIIRSHSLQNDQTAHSVKRRGLQIWLKLKQDGVFFERFGIHQLESLEINITSCFILVGVNKKIKVARTPQQENH